jgi:hypothetical protein
LLEIEWFVQSDIMIIKFVNVFDLCFPADNGLCGSAELAGWRAVGTRWVFAQSFAIARWDGMQE